MLERAYVSLYKDTSVTTTRIFVMISEQTSTDLIYSFAPTNKIKRRTLLMSIRSIREATCLRGDTSALYHAKQWPTVITGALRPARIITINWCLNPADNWWHDKDTIADHKEHNAKTKSAKRTPSSESFLDVSLLCRSSLKQ